MEGKIATDNRKLKMVNVLIVDDENSRTREICAEITIVGVNIDYATTKNEALRKMTATQYDLAIIDIMLPNDAKTVIPSKDGGVDLFTQIESTRRIKKPLNIIGLTSGEDVYNQCKSFFESKLIPLFLWTTCNTVCKEALKNKIDYLIKIDNQRSVAIKADIAIVTAVEAEYNAAKALYAGWKTVELPNDSTIYQITTVMINDSPKTIVLTILPEMGMTAASCFTTKLLQFFNPKQVYMIGICGGIKEEVDLTDVIVASASWDYGSGKIKPKTTTFEITVSNVEKTLYKTTVPAEDTTYAKNYRLRMWITDAADFSSTGVDAEGNPVYPYNGETFIGLVNVYANVPTVVSGE